MLKPIQNISIFNSNTLNNRRIKLNGYVVFVSKDIKATVKNINQKYHLTKVKAKIENNNLVLTSNKDINISKSNISRKVEQINIIKEYPTVSESFIKSNNEELMRVRLEELEELEELEKLINQKENEYKEHKEFFNFVCDPCSKDNPLLHNMGMIYTPTYSNFPLEEEIKELKKEYNRIKLND